ncbi:prenyltransferase [compost metagenome]
MSHLYLGFTIASAPIGAWFAVTGQFAFTPFILGTIVMLWIAGFDIIYGSQDIEFDRNHGLWSIPSIFGLKNGLRIAAVLHSIMVLLLIALIPIRQLGWIYVVGIIVSIVLLLTEHKIIKPSSRKVMKIASYNLNQVISMVILISAMCDYFLL